LLQRRPHGLPDPNIDRIAAEGVRFTDYYGEQSCTAGERRSSRPEPLPHRLTKVGMPGATSARAEDPTIATALKALGYATGQFGKNHFGDRDEFLPTVHGFDEFFGNLYHLNAEEEPELDDYPSEEEFPDFRKNFGPRGVIHSWANADGTQRIEDTGPLTKERMKTIDDEVVPEALRFMTDAKESDTPFFVWLNTTHMHFRTHLKDGSRGQGRPLAVGVPRHDGRPRRAGRSCSTFLDEPGPRREHDRHVLDRQRPAHEHLARRRDDAVPQREELQLGGCLPGARRWCAGPAASGRAGAQRHRQPHRLVRHAARGRRATADVADRLKRAPDLAGTTYKVHLDGSTSSTTSPARRTRARASTSSTSPTTVT
jgi:arylsulfatase